MPAVFARMTKITNAAGRADYISNEKRQEEIVLHRSSMRYTWNEHAEFEATHRKSNTENNEAREVMFKLPNELSDNRAQLEAVCSDIATRLLGKERDWEYAVHWNHARTNLHCHLLFSERENIAEPLPKVYKRDIWYNYETQRIARAGSPGAELIHRKGETQLNPDGSVKYESDLFTAKDTRFKSRAFNYEKLSIIQNVMNEHGFEYDNTTDKDSPYLPQRKLYKGASEDYLAAARAYNNAVKEYNEQIREGFNTRKPDHDMLVDLTALKSVTLDHVKRANHDARRITKKSVSEVLKSVHNVLMDMFTTQMTVTVPSQNIVAAYDGAYALQLGDGYVFFQPHELRRSENGVEIMLEKDAIYSVTSYDGREPYSAKELMDIIQADLEMPQQSQPQRQRQMDDDFEL